MRWISILLLLLIDLALVHSEEKVETHTHFRSRMSDVYVVPNFLPQDLAEKWRDALKDTWKNTLDTINTYKEEQTCSNEDCIQNESSTFYYATNNRGEMQNSNNAKFRSLEMIEHRKAAAKAMYEANQFAYAKWELHPSHPLIEEMEQYMSSYDTRKRVESIIHGRSPNVHLSSDLSDLFVTLFSTGDFLSPHDDGMAGTFAFVVSLMDGEGEWDLSKYGGELRFQCEENNPRTFSGWCKSLKPSFNSLVLIQTRGIGNHIPGPWHEVLSVNDAAQENGFYRYGFTGWYQDEADVMSEKDRMERDKMRARN